MTLTRRRFIRRIGAVVGAAALAAHMRWVETSWWDVTKTRVRMGRGGEATRPVNVLHLSDLHASPVVSLGMLAEAFRVAVRHRPDLILLTGDFFTGIFKQWDAYVPVLRILGDAAPTYAVLGNHDGDEFCEGVGGWATRAQVTDLLTRSGIELLPNVVRRLRVAGREIELVGVGDLWRGECRPELAFADVGRRAAGEGPWRIVLNHNPDAKMRLQPYDWDLALCGHTHGGQVCVPLVGPIFLPVKDRRMAAGLYPWEGRQIFVTRGVGNLLGVRFNCRPELSLLELT